jgi:hypothetical protein
MADLDRSRGVVRGNGNVFRDFGDPNPQLERRVPSWLKLTRTTQTSNYPRLKE